ncbi:MAG: 30S ribosomal protein S17 [Lentisphaerae bacterium GWF2_57_35]|nr:MAG: 30S ribosomal protein S17 [Lentisphaerae bacterium GWF2_57_35]
MGTMIERKNRKERVGIVVSDAMNKTRVVKVERRLRHPVYGKEITTSKKYHVHDEKNETKRGDVVRIMETRPISRLKRWRLLEIVAKGKSEIGGAS